jgi:hypothetical protein
MLDAFNKYNAFALQPILLGYVWEACFSNRFSNPLVLLLHNLPQIHISEAYSLGNPALRYNYFSQVEGKMYRGIVKREREWVHLGRRLEWELRRTWSTTSQSLFQPGNLLLQLMKYKTHLGCYDHFKRKSRRKLIWYLLFFLFSGVLFLCCLPEQTEMELCPLQHLP